MFAYIIFNYKILDRKKIEEIRGLLSPILEKYEAEVIVASPVKTVEGKTYPNMVIHKFKSIEDAEDFYYSKEHQKIIEFRKNITEGWATIVPGYIEDET
ncbi:MAG: DUF1330 domain-containing protein [Woeseiaceae bacterium]